MVRINDELILKICQHSHKMSSEYTWSADFRLRIPTAFNMTEDMSVEFASKVSN